MAHAPALPAEAPADRGEMVHPTVQALPVTPGKVAMWLFLATEVMFFTGLIGSYIVLRAGSPPTAYSNLYPPATDLTVLADQKGVVLEAVAQPTALVFVPTGTGHEKTIVARPTAVILEWAGADKGKVIALLQHDGGLSRQEAESAVETVPLVVRDGMSSRGAGRLRDRLLEAGAQVTIGEAIHPPLVLRAGLSSAQAKAFAEELETTVPGATVEVQGLEPHKWPLPYNHLINPLSIDLTAFNTFILICSSVTMVLALAAIQRGDRRKLSGYLLATVLIGSVFLGIQVIEYYKLILGDLHSIGISRTGHFRPSVSLFASCFFTMTGFHGAHVFGGVVMLSCIFIQSLRGAYTRTHHSPVELVGLYWHFVDLVWIILFTVVYLI